MKKISILSTVALVIFGSIFGCKPKDDKAPQIFFSSDYSKTQAWVLQEYYELPSATATDNVDGDISSSIKISNNLVFYKTREDSIAGQTVYKCSDKIKNGTKGFVGKTGKYTITYNVTDEAGNTGSKSLSVNVENSLNNWAYTSGDVKINYLIKREYVTGDQRRIGGVYDETTQTDEYPFQGVDAKPITTSLSPHKSINYNIKISKLGNITGLGVYINFNRYSRVINFDDQTILAKELAKTNGNLPYVTTPFLYIINQSPEGINEYNPENKSFAITYQVERWKEDVNGPKEYEGKNYSQDRKCTYTETFIQQ